MLEYWEDDGHFYQIDTLNKRYRGVHWEDDSLDVWVEREWDLDTCRKLTRLECKLRGLK